jgi:hypothetical protein
LLGTLEIRAWSRAVFGRGIGTQTLRFGAVMAGGWIDRRVLPSFASTFAAVTAIAVTRAAFAAFTVFGRAGAFGASASVC